MTGTFQYPQDVLGDRSGEAPLHRLAGLATEFGAQQIASTACSIAERISEGRFYVACVGQFKRGKSTLLNALIGHSVLPQALIPVSAIPTIVRYVERLTARVRFQTVAWTDIAVSSVEEYVSEGKNPENAKGVSGVEIFVPSPLLDTGMCLVDTPGLGSVFAGNTAATQAFIPHIDAAIVVVGADPPVSGEELALVEEVGKQVHDLIIVMNKADRTSDEDRQIAKSFTRKIMGKRLTRPIDCIYEVSAEERLENRGAGRDWPLLIDVLEKLERESGSSLVRTAGERGLRRFGEELLTIISEEREALRRPIE